MRNIVELSSLGALLLVGKWKKADTSDRRLNDVSQPHLT